MNTQTSINQFQVLIKNAITVREKALFPDNPLFELPLDSKGEEIVQKEQALLKHVLFQFNKMFDVKNICEKCINENACSQSRDDLGECEKYEEAC